MVKLAEDYLFDESNPQKSITLLDKVAVENRGRKITPEIVQETVQHLYKVPVGSAKEKERQKLLNLEEELHKRIVNQNLAVQEISQAMRRARAGLRREGQKPIGSFLFLGPTGVGKTETAKALAASYFESEGRMHRFDMSEFQNKTDVYRLIGSKREDGKPGMLSQVMKEDPYCLLLFDEIEKAHSDILNLFLQILDEGFVTTTQGKKLVFKNTIIIATSNAGAEFIRQRIRQGQEAEKISNQLVDYLLENDIFRPEFINRFSSVISFSPLTRSQIEQIAQMKVRDLIEEIEEDKDVNLEIDPRVVKEIASRGYNPEMGARPMERAIKRYLENYLARKILSQDLERGDSLTIRLEDIDQGS